MTGREFKSSPSQMGRGTAGTAVEGSRAQRGIGRRSFAGYAGDPLPHFVSTPPSVMGEILLHRLAA